MRAVDPNNFISIEQVLHGFCNIDSISKFQRVFDNPVSKVIVQGIKLHYNYQVTIIINFKDANS